MDVEHGDPEESGGVGCTVEVVASDVVEDLVHTGLHKSLGDVYRHAAVVIDVGLHPHDLGEGVPRLPQRVVAYDGVDLLPLLPESVGEKDLGGADVDTPHEPLCLLLLRDVLPPGEAAIVVGVPEALGVEEFLLVVVEGVVRFLRLAQDEVDLGPRTGVVIDTRLDGKLVSVVYLHVPAVWYLL